MNAKLIRYSLLALIISGITLGIIYRDQLDPASLQIWLEDAGTAAPVIFMLIYISGTVFFLPGSLLTLLGGALFGPILGTFINLTAATIGAMISFLIARFLGADWVEKKMARGNDGRLKHIINGVDNEGWRFVAFTRLVPLFPFNLLNYALGLTKIRFSQYSIASYICMFPGSLAYTYLGYIGKEAATGGEGLIQKVMLALALLAIVAFIPRILKRKQKVNMLNIEELKAHIDNKKELLLLDVRQPQDFTGEQGHIAEARLLPLEELIQRADELNDFKQKPVITICRTDKRSTQAAQILTDLGFEKVQVARMGMTDWNKHRFPLDDA